MPDITDVLGKEADKKSERKTTKKPAKNKKRKDKNDKTLENEELEELEDTEQKDTEDTEDDIDVLGELGELEDDEPTEQDSSLIGMLGGENNPEQDEEEPAPESNPEPKKHKRSMNPEILSEMMMTGDNTDGMFEPDPTTVTDKDDVIHEEVDEKAKVKTSGKVERRGDKYIKLFTEELKENPNEFIIDTPRGKMSINKAMQLGYNPINKKFDKPMLSQQLNGMLDGLNDGDKQSIAQLLSPQNAQIAPADASKYGLSADHPLVKQAHGQGAVPQQGVPPMPQSGGTMMQGGAPAVPPMPQGQQPAPQGGGLDIMSLLGGGN